LWSAARWASTKKSKKEAVYLSLLLALVVSVLNGKWQRQELLYKPFDSNINNCHLEIGSPHFVSRSMITALNKTMLASQLCKDFSLFSTAQNNVL